MSNTVTNEQIAKLPLSGRNILDFALLVPGAAQSTGGRDSHYNGLRGGAINITLDGVNNNSMRFRSGGTSMFVFAPVRLGAIEEVTVSTSGLAAEAGAEGAMQIQFVTKRGSNVLRGQVFDQMRSDKLNANSWVNVARGTPKPKLKQHEYGANVGGPIIKGRLFFFANFEQNYQPGENTQTRGVLTPEAQQGIFRYVTADGTERTANLLSIAAQNQFPSTIDPYIAQQLQMTPDEVGMYLGENFPAVGAGMQTMGPALERFGGMVTMMSNNLDNYDEIKGLDMSLIVLILLIASIVVGITGVLGFFSPEVTTKTKSVPIAAH